MPGVESLILQSDQPYSEENYERRQGFEVAVAKDATAAPKHPQWGYGYTAALINYAFLAHAVWTTDQTVRAMEHGS